MPKKNKKSEEWQSRELVLLCSGKRLNCVQLRKSIETKLIASDIRFLCDIGLRRGNNITRILPTLFEEDRIKLGYLRDMLELKDKKTNLETVTLSRIMACFPAVTLNILHRDKPKMLVPYEELQKIHVDFPHIARVKEGAAALPRSLKADEFRKALAIVLVSSLKTSEILRNSDAWKNVKNKYKASYTLNFVMKAFNSFVLDEERRIKLALKYKVVVYNGEKLTLTEVWQAAGDSALTWIKDNYNMDLATERLSIWI